MINYTKLAQEISLRLRKQREFLGWSRAQLGEVTEKSERSIFLYEANTNTLIPTDALIRLAYHEGWGAGIVKRVLGLEDLKELNGFRYVKNLPDQLAQHFSDVDELKENSAPQIKQKPSASQQNQFNEFQLGIRIFEELFENGHSLRSLKALLGADIDQVYTALRSVFVNHVVRFSRVKQDHELAEKVRVRYGLETVLVADVRTPSNSEVNCFDGTPLRVELVASLAAHEVFSCMHEPKSALLGAGYSIMRMVNNSLASANQFPGTAWIPAASYPREKGAAADFLITPHYSANYLATYLAGRFGRSEAMWLPYIKPGETPNKRDDEAYGEARRIAAASHYAFFSVMGVGRRDGTGKPYKAHDGLAADIRSYGQLQVILEKLEAGNLLDQFAGEVIGHFLDDNGNPLDLPKDIQQSIDELATNISLETLRSIADGGDSWVIAARLYKARAVRAAIVGKLTNKLVIDSEIAQWLLDNPPETL